MAGSRTNPAGKLEETIDKSELFWSGVAHHPKKNILYAANRGTGTGPGNVVVFDTANARMLTRIPVEIMPYDLVLSEDGRSLYVSNLASKSVSVIDTSAMKVVATIPVDENPNQMVLSEDGLLYVACSNDNTVVVVDTKIRLAIERISTTLFPHAPEGSTPNALALDRVNGLLYVANADNNDVAVIHVAAREKRSLGFHSQRLVSIRAGAGSQTAEALLSATVRASGSLFGRSWTGQPASSGRGRQRKH